MKKVLFSVVLLFMGICTISAQKSNVSKAKTKAFNVESPDPQGAKDAIEEALRNPETKNDIKTWYAAGIVYNKIQQDETNKELMGLPFNSDLREECLTKMYPCFVKTDSMDYLPNEKGVIKPKYGKKIKTELLEVYNGASIPQSATKAFEKQDYQVAAKIFDIYLDIPKLSPMKELNLMATDSNYTFYKYNAGIAHGLTRTPQGIQTAIRYFNELTDSDYKDQNAVYQILLDLYLNSANDTASYIQTLEKAVEKFPKEAYYIENLINYFVEKNQSEKAVVYLEKAIENEPMFEQYYFILGIVKERMKLNEEALALFEKAIELKPDHAEAIMGKGRIIYNKAVDADNKANDIKENKAYQEELKNVNKIFEQSIPYFEKAMELKPDDIDNIRTLRSIYYRLKQTEKYEAMEKKLKELGF